MKVAKRNNKLTRTKKQHFTPQSEDVEALKTKESRAKIRRFTYEADCQIIVSAHKNEAGKDIPARTLPMRRLKLDAVSFASAKEARRDCISHEAFLRDSNKLLADSIIHIHAIPHETISPETLQQIQGYKNLSVVLDKALELACLGEGYKSIPAEDNDIIKVKESYYKKALELLKPKEQSNARKDDNQTQQEPSNENVSHAVITDDGSQTTKEEDNSQTESTPDHTDNTEDSVEVEHIQRSEGENDEKELRGEQSSG